MIKTIAKVGNSQCIIVNAPMMELVHLKPGDDVNVEVHKGVKIMLTLMRPRRSPPRGVAGHQGNDEAPGMSAKPANCFHLTVEIARDIHAVVLGAKEWQ